MVRRFRKATQRISCETGLPARRSEEPLHHEAAKTRMTLSTPGGARSRPHAQGGGVSAPPAVPCRSSARDRISRRCCP